MVVNGLPEPQEPCIFRVVVWANDTIGNPTAAAPAAPTVPAFRNLRRLDLGLAVTSPVTFFFVILTPPQRINVECTGPSRYLWTPFNRCRTPARRASDPLFSCCPQAMESLGKYLFSFAYAAPGRSGLRPAAVRPDRARDGFVYAIYQKCKEADSPCTAAHITHATRSRGSPPAKMASRLSRARKPIASRVSRVALPTWGSRKVLSRSRYPG